MTGSINYFLCGQFVSKTPHPPTWAVTGLEFSPLVLLTTVSSVPFGDGLTSIFFPPIFTALAEDLLGFSVIPVSSTSMVRPCWLISWKVLKTWM